MTQKTELELEDLVARIRLANAEHDRKLQETLYAPRQFNLAIATTIAIAFAAGGTFAAGLAAIVKVITS